MIVHCPQCQAQYHVQEKDLSGRTELKVRCTNCQTTFPVKVEAGTVPDAPTIDSSTRQATMVSKLGGELPGGKTFALLATQGPLQGKTFYITKPHVVIGRRGADIVVNDPRVSSEHCTLEVEGETAVLVDLGSANGTLVEGRKIQTCVLEHLSEFRIGATTLMFTVTNK